MSYFSSVLTGNALTMFLLCPSVGHNLAKVKLSTLFSIIILQIVSECNCTGIILNSGYSKISKIMNRKSFLKPMPSCRVWCKSMWTQVMGLRLERRVRISTCTAAANTAPSQSWSTPWAPCFSSPHLVPLLPASLQPPALTYQCPSPLVHRTFCSCLVVVIRSACIILWQLLSIWCCLNARSGSIKPWKN